MCTHQVGYRICAERPHNSGPFHLEKQGMRRARMQSFLVANCPIEILHDILVRNGRFASGFVLKPQLCFEAWLLGSTLWTPWPWILKVTVFPVGLFFAIVVHTCCCTFFLRPVSRRFTECLFQLTMTRQMVYIVFDSQCSPVSMNREILKDPNYLVQNKRNQRNPLGSVV